MQLQQLEPEVTITREGRRRIRFRVACSSCGPVSVQTTQAYADEAAERHTATRHRIEAA
jgi:hypothetical protein